MMSRCDKFSIPPEDPAHPDIPCPAIIHGEPCGVNLRWCPHCEGYHHIDEEFWITQHYAREVISPEDGVGHFRFDIEEPCSVDEFLEALRRVKDK